MQRENGIDQGERLLTSKELAERWHMTTHALAMMRHRNKGPAHQKYGTAIRYRLIDIEAYEELARNSTTDQN